MKRIAFLGGAFDPPHAGHAMLSRRAVELALTDLVLWVPSWCPPHKERGRMAPYADRLAMARLAAAQVPCAEVSDIEARKRFEPSYSLRVLDALETEFPEARMQLLIGEDSLEQLHTWYAARELVKRYEIIAFPRQREAAAERDVHLPEEFWGPELTAKLKASLAAGELVEISSTDLRAKLAKQMDTGSMMADAVREYVRRRGLYGGSATAPDA